MRLLNTRAPKFEEFSSSSGIPPYVILSHTWDAREQTHQDLIALIKKSSSKNSQASQSPWIGVSEKVEKFCAFAASLGYDWAWVDTCCIDKTSSSELSEAINSMFEWYTKSDLCVAYLRDVTSVNTHKQLRKSVWFTRGWTLQELIAPRTVFFTTCDWRIIGTRLSLSEVISSVTGIPAKVLFVHGAFSGASISQRFAWAAKRQTTRLEDRAYSLMGLFGVNMPTVYGEGEKAFIRLQEEILKTSSDQSLFAWGRTSARSLNYSNGTIS